MAADDPAPEIVGSLFFPLEVIGVQDFPTAGSWVSTVVAAIVAAAFLSAVWLLALRVLYGFFTSLRWVVGVWYTIADSQATTTELLRSNAQIYVACCAALRVTPRRWRSTICSGESVTRVEDLSGHRPSLLGRGSLFLLRVGFRAGRAFRVVLGTTVGLAVLLYCLAGALWLRHPDVVDHLTGYLARLGSFMHENVTLAAVVGLLGLVLAYSGSTQWRGRAAYITQRGATAEEVLSRVRVHVDLAARYAADSADDIASSGPGHLRHVVHSVSQGAMAWESSGPVVSPPLPLLRTSGRTPHRGVAESRRRTRTRPRDPLPWPESLELLRGQLGQIERVLGDPTTRLDVLTQAPNGCLDVLAMAWPSTASQHRGESCSTGGSGRGRWDGVVDVGTLESSRDRFRNALLEGVDLLGSHEEYELCEYFRECGIEFQRELKEVVRGLCCLHARLRLCDDAIKRVHYPSSLLQRSRSRLTKA
ncbi:hypothetical protein BJY28_000821 [Janibacter alkaliphilus]|uniref:Uncharacterized protein n=1 Tax=Janibacter alkaliphilus TaxID=1069963 RepID=A0A852WZB0_9MICO|nr:hypothetical protein [Janibacter alkaliphilus]